MARRAVVRLGPGLESSRSVQATFSRCSSRTFSFRFSFSFLRALFSCDRFLIWSSSCVKYSFFFFLEMQALSRFFIIRCCRFKFRRSYTHRDNNDSKIIK